MDRWLIWLRNTVSDQTLTGYSYHVTRLSKWLAARGMELDRASGDDLLAYAAELRDNPARGGAGWRPATVKAAVNSIRSYYAWRFGEKSPAKVVPIPHVPRRRQRYPSQDALLSVLASCDLATPKGRRDLALLYLLLDTGLRASEVCRLRLADVDLESRRLHVAVKGGDEGVGVFGATTANAVLGWLAVRPAVARPDAPTLFVSVGGTSPGAPLTRDGLRAIFRRLGKGAGLSGFSPHDMRRAFAVGMIRLGAPEPLAMLAGRWRDRRSFQRYLDDLSADDLAPYSPVEGLLRLDS